MTKFELFAILFELKGHILLVSLLYDCELCSKGVVVEIYSREIFEHDWYALVNLQVIHESVHFEQAVDVSLIVESLFIGQVIDVNDWRFDG